MAGSGSPMSSSGGGGGARLGWPDSRDGHARWRAQGMASTKTEAGGQHTADSHDLIRVVGARENNLKEVNVELPKRRLTVFTGVSSARARARWSLPPSRPRASG